LCAYIPDWLKANTAWEYVFNIGTNSAVIPCTKEGMTMAAEMQSGEISIFVSDESKRREIFTKLWTQIINETENGRKIKWDKET
jgi:hypothetical protein